MAKPMVLVVDDQPEYARLISLSLAREGFVVRTASGGEEAIDRASELHPDVVLLDINMPGLDGFEVMAELRERWPVPVIMVTGNDALEDRRSGLDRGADDYITKPFAPPELAARVRALLRRAGAATAGTAGRMATAEAGERPDAVGAAAMPAERGRIGRRSLRLLEMLTRNPDKVLYHDELLAHAFGPAFVGDSALLHEEIRRLRRALGVEPWSEGTIRTVHGVGYVFDKKGAVRSRRSRRPTVAALPKAAGRA
jgi:two-component system response regulator RegX3